ncbi:hypothetical protein PISL3812_03408 [Talaromyces islandicus]|uniref:Zn(2)-C6 fungal-type domain-containing protein n=1 Tax=Talaromyces islandicus TaxID=28573 RepID=A0A0U1LTH1_TALIS|nr:hypothetical protein PISL3812_03408 [Talaromyces islandicus]
MANTQTPKLRSACDSCHEAKVRCTGGTPCVHCKNHRHDCHYSVAARIGKPKGSRNRKTLARLREAALNTAGATSQPGSAFPMGPMGAGYATATTSTSISTSAPASISISVPSFSAPADWDLSSYPHGQYASYAWISPQPIPTPPESVDLGCKNLPLHHDHIVTQSSHSPSLNSVTSISHPGDIYPADHGSPGYAASFQTAACGCFHWQTSSVASLQALKSQGVLGQHDVFDESMQCVEATFAACQRTAGCPSCEKDSSLIMFLVASLQMAVDQLESLLVAQLKAAFAANNPMPGLSQGDSGTLRMMQLRHMLLRAQSTLGDLRDVTELARVRSPGRRVSDSALLVSDSNDPDYLWRVLDRLHAGIDTLVGTVGSYMV